MKIQIINFFQHYHSASARGGSPASISPSAQGCARPSPALSLAAKDQLRRTTVDLGS